METITKESDVPSLRLYDPVADYATVCGWWEQNDREPVAECMLSEFGVMVVDGEEAVACAWFYVNNSSKVAKVSHSVTNPARIDGEQRLERICEFFQTEATKIGKYLDVERPFQGMALGPIHSYSDDFIDQCEARMAEREPFDFPLVHRFTPGMYIRQMHMPAGSLVTSRIHLTEHPFVISQGDVSVLTRDVGVARLKAPFTGITQPGTRRLFFAHEDTIWTTFHATRETDVAVIEDTILEKRLNPLLERKAHKWLIGS